VNFPIAWPSYRKKTIIHYHLGLVYHKKGEKQKARLALEQALKLDERFDGADKARQNLAEI